MARLIGAARLPGTELTFAERRAAKLSALANRRWQAETGGIVVGGVSVKTDRESQGVLTGAYVKAADDPSFAIANWKVAPGTFVTLDAASIIAIGDAVTAHVQECFDREADLDAAIMAVADGDVAALDAIDIETGWPT